MAYLGKLKDEQTALSKQIAELVIYSEGAVSWAEAWNIPPQDRDLLIKTLNRCNTLKSGKPGAEEM